MNLVIATGRLTAAPDIKYYQNNDGCYCHFSIAINNGKDRDGNEYSPDFIPCVAFNASAEYLYKYADKGSRITVQGRWKSGNYENEEGDKIYTNECFVNKIEIIDFIQYDEYDEKPKTKTNNNKKSSNRKQDETRQNKTTEKPKRRPQVKRNRHPNSKDGGNYFPDNIDDSREY